jgi:hypothetical protein
MELMVNSNIKYAQIEMRIIAVKYKSGRSCNFLEDMCFQELAIVLLVFLKFKLVFHLPIEQHDAFVFHIHVIILSRDYIAQMVLHPGIRQLAHAGSLAHLALFLILKVKAILGNCALLELSIGLNSVEIDLHALNFGVLSLEGIQAEEEASIAGVVVQCLFEVAQ